MTDSNQNITRKFDLSRKKIKLKIDFDSSLTCYNLDPKSICINFNHTENKISIFLWSGTEMRLDNTKFEITMYNLYFKVNQ